VALFFKHTMELKSCEKRERERERKKESKRAAATL
jgi:hypothetical protein